VVVVGLGPAGPGLVTTEVRDAIERISMRFVRTTRHPSAGVVEPAISFDDVYDAASDLEEVYGAIAARLVAAASEHGEVLYAVPGSPAVAERTVELLRADPEVDVVVLAALSFLDLAWVRLGIDPVAAGVRVVDGHRFDTEAAGERGPLLVAQCDSQQVLSAVKLAFDDVMPATVTVLQRLGLDDERVEVVAWEDLDREVEADHLTSLYLPALAVPVAGELAAFAVVVRRLREECPWDREQTHESLTRYLIEEAYEVVDAIESGDGAHLEEELGDLLLQVFLHSAIATQAGEFTLADVARGITDKMIRRHPHVFGDVSVSGPDDVRRNWEQIKAAEKRDAAVASDGVGSGGGAASVIDGIPVGLPALQRAAKVAKRAAIVGFDWDALAPVYDKVQEEIAELQADPSADELGDVLFAVVNVARHLGLDPEAALRGATAKFSSRFRSVEQAAAARGIDLASAGAAVLDELWDAAKVAERSAPPLPA